MEEYDLPLAHRLTGDERCAVTELCNDTFAQIRAGLGDHLGRDGDVIGHGQTIEGRVLVEGGKRLGFSPAHRAADGAAARTQTDGHQRILDVPADIARGKARPGEAQEHPAVFNPVADAVALALRQAGHIGQHDHVGIGEQDVL